MAMVYGMTMVVVVLTAFALKTIPDNTIRLIVLLCALGAVSLTFILISKHKNE